MINMINCRILGFSFKVSGTKATSLPHLSWEDHPLPRAGLVVVPFLAMAVGLLAGLLGLGGGAAVQAMATAGAGSKNHNSFEVNKKGMIWIRGTISNSKWSI